MILEPDYLDFLKMLNKNEVIYMVVGGYALAAHNAPRFTGDMDIWLKPDIENAKKTVRAIEDFGFGSLGITEKDFLSKNYFIQIGYAPVRIDITADISGITFEEAYSRKKVIDLSGLSVCFIGLEDLIKNKIASGRAQDIADVEKLQKLVSRKKGK
jgi:predicted nucleotidyltransferase